MVTLVFWLSICITPNQCNEFEPMVWTYTTEEQRALAFKECSILANAYAQLKSTKEVDCYIEE